MFNINTLIYKLGCAKENKGFTNSLIHKFMQQKKTMN